MKKFRKTLRKPSPGSFGSFSSSLRPCELSLGGIVQNPMSLRETVTRRLPPEDIVTFHSADENYRSTQTRRTRVFGRDYIEELTINAPTMEISHLENRVQAVHRRLGPETNSHSLSKIRLDCFLEDRQLFLICGLRIVTNPEVIRRSKREGRSRTVSVSVGLNRLSPKASSHEASEVRESHDGEYVLLVELCPVEFTTASGDGIIVGEPRWISPIAIDSGSQESVDIILEAS